MQYVIVYLIRGKAREYQKKLIKKVADISGERYVAYENPIPQHVTLKSPFKIRSIRRVERTLRKFTKDKKPYPIRINGFGNFRRGLVVFLNTKFSFRGRRIQKKLIKLLKQEANLKLHEFDKKWKPHATIAYGNTNETFYEIWSYLKKIEKPKFDMEFDNITILKKPRKGRWRIYKVFEIG